MKSFNGRFDIREDYDPPNRSVYSLKLTDAAFTELKDAFKHNRMQIVFKTETEGKIRFDSTKQWQEVGKPFSETNQPAELVVFEHINRNKHVTNFGDVSKSFKINPNVTDSRKKFQEDTLSIQKAKQDSSTKVLETKTNKWAPKFAQKRAKQKLNKMATNPTSPDSTSHQSRTPTPPPTNAVEKQFGSFESRILHIMALTNNKTVDTVKETLHRRKLIAGPSDLPKIVPTLERIALKRNNKWSLKKESLDRLQSDWAGYNLKERQQVVDFVTAEKDHLPIKRKSEAMTESDSRSTTPVVEDDTKHGKRQRLMNTAQPAKIRFQKSPSSRDSDPSNLTHFKPVESPAMSMSSNGSQHSPSVLSESSQLSPSSPKSHTPNHVSPVSNKPKSDVMKNYERLQRNIKEKTYERERARKLSNDEVNENAVKAGLTNQDIDQLKADLERNYPRIQSEREESEYLRQCQAAHERYLELKPGIEHTNARFDKYEKEIRRLRQGTQEYQELYRKVLEDYRRECGNGFLRKKKEYHSTIERFTHLKRKLSEYHG